MASQEGSQTIINLKVLIDKEKNKIVMAESYSDFVDLLFSFLTMPMGTIVRVLGKQSQPNTIGSLTTLYKEVENLEDQLLQTEECKSMLLHPRNPSEDECRKVKLNIDDTEPTKYYICADWNCSRRESGGLYTTFKNVRCNCGKMMNREIHIVRQSKVASAEGYGVFVSGKTKFMVTDDLQVEPLSTATILTQLRKLGLKDMSSLQETTLSIGSEEILKLLKGILFSKAPLTDVFLRKQEFTSEGLKLEMGNVLQSSSLSSTGGMTLKLMMSKSMNKVLYAEAGEDMVDFLLSILTFPLGFILQLLEGNSSVGSIDNLYKSVQCSGVIRADGLRNLLRQPVLGCGFGCSSNPLGVKESEPPPPPLWCISTFNTHPPTAYLITEKPLKYSSQYHSLLQFVNPKSPTSETEGQGGYLKQPETFFITDNLVFTPLASFCIVSFLKSMEFPLNDLDVRMVKVGNVEALRLLKASLFSNSVLTDGLVKLVNFGLKSPKQEK